MSMVENDSHQNYAIITLRQQHAADPATYPGASAD